MTAQQQIDALKTLTQAAASWLLGYKSSRSLRDAPDAPRNEDGSYNASDLVAWFVERSSDDPMAGIVESTPALERWRLARARQAEDDLAIRRRDLVEGDVLDEATGRAFTPIRRFAEEQIKEHGGGTEAAWAEAVEQFRRELESILRERQNPDVSAAAIPEAADPDQ